MNLLTATRVYPMGDRILVPYDGSNSSEAALRFSFEKFPDANVVVLHVVEPFAEHTEAGSEAYRGEWGETAGEYATETLERAKDIATEYDRDVETAWRYGRPGNTILEYTEEETIDHVVMGSHGRSGLDRLLLGSVAETTMRRSPVPVTVVRE